MINVTLTGVDNRTCLSELPGDCEIGVLYTETPEDRNRYPNADQLKRILHRLQGRPVALHVCGRTAREKVRRGFVPCFTDHVQRIQINGVVSIVELGCIALAYPDHEIITQHTTKNAELANLDLTNHSLLIDASGGRGISPELWERPETAKPVGFAGGLGPDNVERELDLIQREASDEWWIDMEGKLRDADDWFDVYRADQVMAAVRQFAAVSHH